MLRCHFRKTTRRVRGKEAAEAAATAATDAAAGPAASGQGCNKVEKARLHAKEEVKIRGIVEVKTTTAAATTRDRRTALISTRGPAGSSLVLCTRAQMS